MDWNCWVSSFGSDGEYVDGTLLMVFHELRILATSVEASYKQLTSRSYGHPCSQILLHHSDTRTGTMRPNLAAMCHASEGLRGMLPSESWLSLMHTRLTAKTDERTKSFRSSPSAVTNGIIIPLPFFSATSFLSVMCTRSAVCRVPPLHSRIAKDWRGRLPFGLICSQSTSAHFLLRMTQGTVACAAYIYMCQATSSLF